MILTLVYFWKFITQGGYRANEWLRACEAEFARQKDTGEQGGEHD